jgi:hypothetical protein
LTSLLEKARQFVLGRQHAYKQTFQGPLAEEVLKDLARFCRANVTTFHEDARAHAVAEGRREVFLRIQNNLNLSPAEVWRLASGRED